VGGNMDENKEDIKQIFSDIEIGSPEYKSFFHPSNRDILLYSEQVHL
jgi:hypothetical protein